MTAQTIDEVIEELGRLIAHFQTQGSRLGYFPALYRNVTLAVKDGVERGRFEDGARMERLDVRFANIYFQAIEQWQRGAQPRPSWEVAFQAAEDWPPVVLQHLLLGMNAHINIDLAIATARTATRDGLPALQHDFDEINAVLSEQTVGVKEKLSAIWPRLRVYDALAGDLEDGFIYFSLTRARQHAWQMAEHLAQLDEAGRRAEIDAADRRIALLGHTIWKPPLRTRLILLGIRLGERGAVQENINLLRGE